LLLLFLKNKNENVEFSKIINKQICTGFGVGGLGVGAGV